MPRAPRFVPPGSLVEVTTRTSGGLLLLRPSAELNQRILGILGRALALYPLSLHAFVFMSNHWHALITAPDAARLSSFLCYVNGNIAKAAQELHEWTGLVWGRRAQIISVVDDEAAEQRLRYILSHGAKEGLVERPGEWPGVSSTNALACGEALTGNWRSRAKNRRIVRSGSGKGSDEGVNYTIDLAPLPAWRERSPHAYRKMVASLISSIHREERAAHPRPLGVAAILTQNPLGTATPLEPHGAPKVHASSIAGRDTFLAARSAFIRIYREAVRELTVSADTLTAQFPPGAFPPRMPPSSSNPRPQGAALAS
jgi:REP element-mobilizing transposase RayT